MAVTTAIVLQCMRDNLLEVIAMEEKLEAAYEAVRGAERVLSKREEYDPEVACCVAALRYAVSLLVLALDEVERLPSQ